MLIAVISWVQCASEPCNHNPSIHSTSFDSSVGRAQDCNGYRWHLDVAGSIPARRKQIVGCRHFLSKTTCLTLFISHERWGLASPVFLLVYVRSRVPWLLVDVLLQPDIMCQAVLGTTQFFFSSVVMHRIH